MGGKGRKLLSFLIKILENASGPDPKYKELNMTNEIFKQLSAIDEVMIFLKEVGFIEQASKPNYLGLPKDNRLDEALHVLLVVVKTPAQPEERLKTMVETVYLNKNRELKELARTIDVVETNRDLLRTIQGNDWSGLDNYFRVMAGEDNFLINLQQLLIFKYRVGITRKQFQIAMGIQQMVWMTDPENCIVKQLGMPDSKFTLWEEIPREEKEEILRILHGRISQRYRAIDILSDEFFTGTVWYSVSGLRGPWPGFGITRQFYPIPETLNFTRITSIYVPELVFGILGDISLTKHIAEKSRRPYIANLPRKGICDLHTRQYHICTIWIHDFTHASTDDGRRVSLTSTLEKMEPYKHWLADPAHSVYKATDKKLQTIIAENPPTAEDAIALKEIVASREMNDSGFIWKEVETVEGGKKRATRRSRRSRRSRRRPIAASRTARRVASHLSVRKTRSNTLSALR